MQVNITGNHIDITEPLHDYVMNRLEKLPRRFSNITNVHVILSVEKQLQKAEAHINISQGEIHASAEAEDMYAAIDALSDKLDRQVIKHKEKLKDRGDKDR